MDKQTNDGVRLFESMAEYQCHCYLFDAVIYGGTHNLLHYTECSKNISPDKVVFGASGGGSIVEIASIIIYE